MHPENARIIAGQRWAELAVSRRLGPTGEATHTSGGFLLPGSGTTLRRIELIQIGEPVIPTVQLTIAQMAARQLSEIERSSRLSWPRTPPVGRALPNSHGAHAALR